MTTAAGAVARRRDVDGMRERVVGRRVPVGTFHVATQDAWLAADAVRSPELPAGVAHPFFLFIGGVVGMGVTLEEMWAWCDAGIDDGLLLGEFFLQQDRPIRIDETLTVGGRILSLERKTGRSGIFDLLRFELIFTDESGDRVGRVENTFVLPRPEIEVTA